MSLVNVSVTKHKSVLIMMNRLRTQYSLAIGSMLVLIVGLILSTPGSISNTTEKSLFYPKTKIAVNNSFIPNLTWNQTYNLSSFDIIHSGVETIDGGLAFLGYTDHPINKEDIWLFKTDPNGNILWSRTFGGTAEDFGRALIQTNDGALLLAGYTYDAGSADAFLIKTNSEGKKEWQQTYGETQSISCEDVVTCIIQTTDGGFALAGFSRSYGEGDPDAWLLKTNANGELQWSQTYGGPLWDQVESIVQAKDGGYILAGTLNIGELPSPSEFWVAKTDSAGIITWNFTIGTRRDDYAYSVIQAIDGGYAVAGATILDADVSRNHEFWLVKIDSQGAIEWNQTYGGEETDKAYSVVQTADGGYALLGKTDSFGAGSFDYWLVKTDANGNIMWNQTYGSINYENGLSILKTSDGGLVLIGYSESIVTFNPKFLAIKVGGSLISYSLPTTQSSFVNFVPLSFLVLAVIALILVKYRK